MNRCKTKFFLTAALLLLCVFGLAGCSKYHSNYTAVGFVHSNTSGSAFMTFMDFSGTMALKLKNKNGSDGQIVYSGKIGTGDAAVYYDSGLGKKELFTLKGGDEVSSALPLTGNGTVYILVETQGLCENGNFHFDVR